MEATKSQPRSRKIAHKSPDDRARNHSNLICARSVALLSYHLLGQEIIPCVPYTDIRGYDMITDYYGQLCRAQVRSAGLRRGEQKPFLAPSSFTFSILRQRKKKAPTEHTPFVANRHFAPGEVDVFVFVHVDYQYIFIVPTRAIDLTRTKFTVHVGDRWQNAWTELRQQPQT
jgi:hypothetical protein